PSGTVPTRQLFFIEIARRAVEAVAVRVEPDARPVEKMGAVFGEGAALKHDVARGHDMVAAGFTGGGIGVRAGNNQVHERVVATRIAFVDSGYELVVRFRAGARIMQHPE